MLKTKQWANNRLSQNTQTTNESMSFVTAENSLIWINTQIYSISKEKATTCKESWSIKIIVYKAFSIYSCLYWVQLGKTVASPWPHL